MNTTTPFWYLNATTTVQSKDIKTETIYRYFMWPLFQVFHRLIQKVGCILQYFKGLSNEINDNMLGKTLSMHTPGKIYYIVCCDCLSFSVSMMNPPVWSKTSIRKRKVMFRVHYDNDHNIALNAYENIEYWLYMK